MKSQFTFSTAQPYTILRDRYLPKTFSFREPANFYEPIPISERLVQVIWSDQLFKQTHLSTRDSQTIQILNPGRWNIESGPDFKGAHLRIGDHLFHGDVEIHLYSTGWNEHRHHLDSAYNGVILDVCLWDLSASPIHTSHGKTIPQLVLHPYIQSSLGELAESLDPDRYPFSPSRTINSLSPLLQLSRPEIISHVNSAGVFRFEQKVARITDIINRDGSDQAAYQFIAEALGYKHNKIPFRQTSMALPLTSLLRLQSIDSKIDALISQAECHHIHLTQVRPANHPHRRLAALAILMEQYPKPASWFHDLLKDPAQLRYPPKLNHPFWSLHYHRQSRPLIKPVSLLGASRWSEIVGNIILPFCIAELRANKNHAAAQGLLQIYMNFPCPQTNLSSRHIAYELGLPKPTKTIAQQGLIQIYQDFELLRPDQPSSKESAYQT